jgi:hypothetical protein
LVQHAFQNFFTFNTFSRYRFSLFFLAQVAKPMLATRFHRFLYSIQTMRANGNYLGLFKIFLALRTMFFAFSDAHLIFSIRFFERALSFFYTLCQKIVFQSLIFSKYTFNFSNKNGKKKCEYRDA